VPRQPGFYEDSAGLLACLERAVERSEPLLTDFACKLILDVDLGARAELIGEDGLGATPRSLRQVTAVDGDVVTVFVDPADDHMDVRVVGVPVIDGAPHQSATEVRLHLSHQPASERGQIHFRSVLGRDDEPKLALLALNRRTQRRPNVRHLGGAVDTPGGAVLLDAIAFDVREMEGHRALAVRVQGDEPRLDDTAARGWAGTRYVAG
jgi:hypothetical protein